MDYEDDESGYDRIEGDNKILLSEFEDWLTKKGFTPKTIGKHVSNVDFYINEFLMYSECIEAKDGASEISMYLGYWFIKKALWSGKAAIKENAASLKKFYQFMLEKGEISEEDLSDLKITIKEEMPEWLETMERYLDEDINDMEEVWGF